MPRSGASGQALSIAGIKEPGIFGVMEPGGVAWIGLERGLKNGADGGMPQCLGQVALAGTARSGDQDAGLLLNVAAGGQVIDSRPVQVWQAVEVEALQGLLPAEAGAAHALAEFLLVPASQFVVDKQGEEVGVGQLTLDGFAIAYFQRVENARQAQLLEGGGEFGDRIHGIQ